MKASFILEKPCATYFPGDYVTGSFSFENLETNQKIIKVKISLKGKSSVEFMKDTDDYKSICIFTSEKNLHLEDQKSYRGVIIKSEDEYYSHFSFKIPSNWPHSFRGIYGRIRYTLKGDVIINRNDTKSKEFEINIQPKLPLSIIHQKNEINYINEIVPIEFCDCCKNSSVDEKIQFLIKTERKVYKPNENVNFYIKITNKSSKTITKFRYYFLREEKYEGNMAMSDVISLFNTYNNNNNSTILTHIHEMRKKIFIVNVNIGSGEKKILTTLLNVGKTTTGVDFGGNINVKHFIVVEAIMQDITNKAVASARLRLYIDSVDFEKETNFSKT
ncbi:Arrestin-like, N-terminal domain and Arrestin C-terminal-like domain and Immunoglobulin E-set domain-containing protein [Strongyloides ratti]|uniref:Arrestin-like, N-terminal domain and Arrestin C-terminal-like domain and Immunoglobulin E-set domain-containing protein n=1 Tax=Strongyloides ratti TaxID=34506 RepID=A0A090KWD5_STRRB|nr:Arrestin-like, N-terminal domain and Arrestin C-terminal-like domain and Immunoglobulin E-set domain-containing protein [Strongyloides ratti]CEF61810.1 Arrestin-like, N-terminal domain and Arrestin C-terminal-like domain and Immunoglobulin E-set domain-containing protein [Strongyloides ratti]